MKCPGEVMYIIFTLRKIVCRVSGIKIRPRKKTKTIDSIQYGFFESNSD
jgi:hypothetical protein